MVFHRLIANLQRLRNLFITIPARDIVQNLHFASGERGVETFGDWLFVMTTSSRND